MNQISWESSYSTHKFHSKTTHLNLIVALEECQRKSLRFTLWGTWISKTKLKAKPQITWADVWLDTWKHWWAERKSQRTTKVIGIHPLRNMNFRTKFCANPRIICADIELNKGNVDLLVTLEERSDDHQSHWGSSSGDHECSFKN